MCCRKRININQLIMKIKNMGDKESKFAYTRSRFLVDNSVFTLKYLSAPLAQLVRASDS